MFGTLNSTILGTWLGDAASSNSSFLLAASFGNGYYDHDLQIGYTTNFATTNLYAVFTTMFGSYYGDWDSAIITNAVLLAPIASGGYTLSSYYHDNIMNVGSSAIGEPIGQEMYAEAHSVFHGANPTYYAYGLFDTNTETTYLNAVQPKCYITLMGDPTLKQFQVAPPSNIVVTTNGSDTVIAWTAATESGIQGYHVYRAPASDYNSFARLTTNPTTSPTLIRAGQARHTLTWCGPLSWRTHRSGASTTRARACSRSQAGQNLQRRRARSGTACACAERYLGNGRNLMDNDCKKRARI